jgi:hypothetical protein
LLSSKVKIIMSTDVCVIFISPVKIISKTLLKNSKHGY